MNRHDGRQFSSREEKEYYSQDWPRQALPYRHLAPWLTSWLPEGERLFRQRRVLDIGAGEAVYSRLIADLYHPEFVIASDLFAERMIPAARARDNDRVAFVGANCFLLPFSDGAFDVVFGSLILHQLPDLPSLVPELSRVLSRHGAYVGIEVNPLSPITQWRYWTAEHSPNQYLLGRRHLDAFGKRGFDVEVRYFWGRFPKLRNRFLATCMGIVARKHT